MEIKRIVKSGKFYKLITDEEEVKILKKNTIADFKLFSGQELSSEKLAEIKFKDKEAYFYDRAIYLLSRRPRSKREIETYLRKKLYNEDLDIKLMIENVISRLKKDNYINDTKFAEWWIDNRIRNNTKGPKLITAELLQKGVDKGTIQMLLNKTEDLSFQENCIKLAKKKFPKIKAKDERERTQKLKRYLLGKGFNWKSINKAIDSI